MRGFLRAGLLDFHCTKNKFELNIKFKADFSKLIIIGRRKIPSTFIR